MADPDADAPATFAVVACSSCRQPWAVDLRHATVACPGCKTATELAQRRRLWEGRDAREAQAAAASHRARLTGGDQAATAIQVLQRRPEPRHDSPSDAAAAQATGIVNLSARAEAVALWMTRLTGMPTHADLLEGMAKAGIPRERAEREVVRMLATDLLMEPKAGRYRLIDA